MSKPLDKIIHLCILMSRLKKGGETPRQHKTQKRYLPKGKELARMSQRFHLIPQISGKKGGRL